MCKYHVTNVNTTYRRSYPYCQDTAKRTDKQNELVECLCGHFVDVGVRRREVRGDGGHGETDDVRHVWTDTRQNVAKDAECHQRHLAVDVSQTRHKVIEDLHRQYSGGVSRFFTAHQHNRKVNPLTPSVAMWVQL